MINLDLDKVFHPKVADLLHGFLPGLFFVVCVVLGSPPYMKPLIAAGADRYIQLFVALFIAFVIGSALMLWVRFTQILWINVYRYIVEWKLKVLNWRIAREQTRRNLVQPGQPPPAPSQTLLRLQEADNRRFQHDEDANSVRDAWTKVAGQLLKCYDVKVAPPWAWGPWAHVLGLDEIRPQDQRGYIFVMALHATGWAGLLACYFVPSLQIWPFAIFSLFLIGYGLLHDRQLAMMLNDKVYGWTMPLRCALDELRKVQERNKTGSIERVSAMED